MPFFHRYYSERLTTTQPWYLLFSNGRSQVESQKAAPNWYYFSYHLHCASSRTELVPKSDVRRLSVTDLLEGRVAGWVTWQYLLKTIGPPGFRQDGVVTLVEAPVIKILLSVCIWTVIPSKCVGGFITCQRNRKRKTKSTRSQMKKKTRGHP